MRQTDSLKDPPQGAHGAIWVVTADAGRVRTFSAEQSNGQLVELEDLLNPEMRLREGGATSAPKGRVMQGPGRVGQTFEPHHTQSQHSADSFAKTVCEKMEAARQEGKVAKIYLIAEPSFLGLIRRHIHPSTEPLIVRELPRDLSRQPAADIRKALPRRL